MTYIALLSTNQSADILRASDNTHHYYGNIAIALIKDIKNQNQQ